MASIKDLATKVAAPQMYMKSECYSDMRERVWLEVFVLWAGQRHDEVKNSLEAADQILKEFDKRFTQNG